MRDDFTKTTKEILAKRVGHRCSNPNCLKSTIGPGSSENDVSNIGVAAHICAAAPGGPRYDSKMSSEQRKSIRNGIWLCQNCAHLIDADEEQYTVDILNTWKNSAEQRALQQITSNKTPPIEEPVLNIDVRNRIFTDLQCMKEKGELLRKLSVHYKIANNSKYDRYVYQFCVDIFDAGQDLLYQEAQNHIQLHKLKLDKTIIELPRLIPILNNRENDWTNARKLATIYNYIYFFGSEGGETFIIRCTKLMQIIEQD